MSRTFLHFFNPFIDSFISFKSKNDNFNKIQDLSIIGFCSAIIVGQCAYALGTIDKKLVKIDKKYTFNRNGLTEFMIIDDTGKHYNVNNSLWYWKWDSIEDWHKLEPGKEIVIKYYGWRVPIFGLFPNIIMSKQDNVLDSITSSECRVIEYNRNQETNSKKNTI